MLRKFLITASVIPALALSGWALAQQMERSSAPEGAAVYIVSPQDGAVVPETFTVQFGLSGMGVAPAGVERENTGHHHLLVNYEGEVQSGQPLGGDVMHFGGGQTETTLTLEPGEHTLQLVLGDHLHIPHNPPVMSEKITVTVR
ncbi:MAG: DUF4399 domain-containing protein [Pseudomonadota bacterium]